MQDDMATLSQESKNQILKQRLVQFEGEKFNHAVNRQILEDQLKTAQENEKSEIEDHIATTNRAIEMLDLAMDTTRSLIVETPTVEVKK